jgi:peptidoglycan/LPS O-acetylase OafA/YrhL
MNTHDEISYRKDIDGLRAIAVLAVVGYHGFPNWIPGGFVGVDVFFVISGFLITSIIVKGLERGSFRYADFYVRRIRRIFPALTIVLITSLVIGWFLLRSDDYIELGKNVAGGAAFVANFIYWQEAGYFDTDVLSKPLLHLWSLAVEEQFYVFWPLLLGFVWKISKSWALIATGAIAILSFYFNVIELANDPAGAFYLPFGRLWELLLGAGLSFLQGRLNSPWHKWLAPAGLALIVIAIFVFTSMSPYPGWRAIVPTCGAAFLIAAGPSAWPNCRVLSQRALVWIGLISYPLYLWHWPLLVFGRSIASDGGAILDRNSRIILVASSFVLAWLTYRFLETPIRFRFRIPPMALAGGLSAALALGLLIVLTDGAPDRYVSGGPKGQFLQYYERLHKSGLSAAYREECDFYDWKTKLRKVISKECTAPGREGTWFLWGDSHAMALSLGLRSLLPNGVTLAQVVSSGCPPSLVRTELLHCNISNEYARAEIARLHPYALIMAQKNEHELQDWDSLASFARVHGVQKVFLVGPVPQWVPSLPGIIADHYWNKDPFTVSIGLDASVMATDSKLRDRYKDDPDLKYISIISGLCTEDGCQARIPGESRNPGEWPRNLLVLDYGHLTPEGSIYVAQHVLTASLHPEEPFIAAGALHSRHPLDMGRDLRAGN